MNHRCARLETVNGHKNGNQAPNIGFLSKFLFVHASIVDRGAVGKKKMREENNQERASGV